MFYSVLFCINLYVADLASIFMCICGGRFSKTSISNVELVLMAPVVHNYAVFVHRLRVALLRPVEPLCTKSVTRRLQWIYSSL